MSRVYFHSPNSETELSGCERAHMSNVIDRVSWAITGFESFVQGENDIAAVKKCFPPSDYIQHDNGRGGQFWHDLRYYMNNGSSSIHLPDREPVSCWVMALNTCYVIGADPLKLFCRLHGQCELHCWVEGKNREWLAGIIEQGLASGLYREDMGWEGVRLFLLGNDAEPVVTSYSVCEGFPDRTMVDNPNPPDADGNEYDDWFYDLPDETQWTLCMGSMHQQHPALELKPDGFGDYFFEPRFTVFDWLKYLAVSK